MQAPIWRPQFYPDIYVPMAIQGVDFLLWPQGNDSIVSSWSGRRLSASRCSGLLMNHRGRIPEVLGVNGAKVDEGRVPGHVHRSLLVGSILVMDRKALLSATVVGWRLPSWEARYICPGMCVLYGHVNGISRG